MVGQSAPSDKPYRRDVDASRQPKQKLVPSLRSEDLSSGPQRRTVARLFASNTSCPYGGHAAAPKDGRMPANHALPLPHSLTHLPDDPVEIARLLSNCRDADAAEALNRIGQTRALQAIEAMAPEVAVRVFNEPIWTMPPSSWRCFRPKGHRQ